MSILNIEKYNLGDKIISKITGKYWAFVYKEDKIISDINFYESSTTETPHTLFASTTEQECHNEKSEVTGVTFF